MGWSELAVYGAVLLIAFGAFGSIMVTVTRRVVRREVAKVHALHVEIAALKAEIAELRAILERR